MTITPTEPTKETNRAYFFEYEGNEAVNLSNLNLPKKKPLNVILNNTAEDIKNFTSTSNYIEAITITGGKYTIYLSGTNSNKTVKLGDSSGNIVIASNIGKNTINAGDGGNNFQADNQSSNNTIRSGKGKDTYTLQNGTTKITDKGGKNDYSIYGGTNIITDKGSEGSAFRVTSDITSEGGVSVIKSGNGKDYINVYNDGTPKNELIITADLGKGDDEVLVDYKNNPLYAYNTSILNIKTGNGEDKIIVKAGKSNNIDTGKDNDKVEIYGGKDNYISTGDGIDTITINGTATTSSTTIKAGRGDDLIEVFAGDTTIYGEAGKDNILINSNEETIVYGGNDTITVESLMGISNIYASSDTINLINGINEVYAQKGNNTINVKSYTAGNASNNAIYLQKGNNTVNLKGETANKPASALIHITSGKNTINAEGYSLLDIDTKNADSETVNLKTAQKVNISGNAIVDSIQLGSGADTITHSSLADESGYYGIYTGAGNDKIYISNGSHKFFHGEDGNDYFEVKSGDYDTVKGGLGNDTFIINGGTNHYIECNGGNDKIIINGGNNCKIYGNSGNDTFTINGGYNDTIDGGEGNDIYNIFKVGSAEINDNDGKNTYNVKKDYTGRLTINDTSKTSNVIFADRSLKLSNQNNVSDNNSINTDGKTLSVWCNYIFYNNTGFGNSKQISLVYDIESDIADNGFVNGNCIYINNAEDMGSYLIGGKKYTLNLDQLKSDLAAWNTAHGGNNWDVAEIMSGSDEEAKTSLVAIFTKDTANCFIKA